MRRASRCCTRSGIVWVVSWVALHGYVVLVGSRARREDLFCVFVADRTRICLCFGMFECSAVPREAVGGRVSTAYRRQRAVVMIVGQVRA